MTIQVVHEWQVNENTRHQVGRDETGQLWWQQWRRYEGGEDYFPCGWNAYESHHGGIEAEELLRLVERDKAVRYLIAGQPEEPEAGSFWRNTALPLMEQLAPYMQGGDTYAETLRRLLGELQERRDSKWCECGHLVKDHDMRPGAGGRCAGGSDHGGCLCARLQPQEPRREAGGVDASARALAEEAVNWIGAAIAVLANSGSPRLAENGKDLADRLTAALRSGEQAGAEPTGGYSAWHQFHRLWTWAVGQSGYDKKAWMEAERLIFVGRLESDIGARLQRVEEVRRAIDRAARRPYAPGATESQCRSWAARLADPAPEPTPVEVTEDDLKGDFMGRLYTPVPESPVAGGGPADRAREEAAAALRRMAESERAWARNSSSREGRIASFAEAGRLERLAAKVAPASPAPEPAATEAEEERSDEGDPRYWPAPERKNCCMPDRCLSPHPDHDSSKCFDREMVEAQAADAEGGDSGLIYDNLPDCAVYVADALRALAKGEGGRGEQPVRVMPHVLERLAVHLDAQSFAGQEALVRRERLDRFAAASLAGLRTHHVHGEEPADALAVGAAQDAVALLAALDRAENTQP